MRNRKNTYLGVFFVRGSRLWPIFFDDRIQYSVRDSSQDFVKQIRDVRPACHAQHYEMCWSALWVKIFIQSNITEVNNMGRNSYQCFLFEWLKSCSGAERFRRSGKNPFQHAERELVQFLWILHVFISSLYTNRIASLFYFAVFGFKNLKKNREINKLLIAEADSWEEV